MNDHKHASCLFSSKHTSKKNYWKIAMQFYKRLKTRGWDKRTLEPIFTAAQKQLLSQPERTTVTQENEISTQDQMILHL